MCSSEGNSADRINTYFRTKLTEDNNYQYCQEAGAMIRFRKVFESGMCNVIAMVHVRALPGTPCYDGSVSHIVDNACRETEVYKKCGVDGILVENMHDIPYVQPNSFGPETVSLMTKVCSEVRKLSLSTPCGVQVLAGGNKEALAVALASGCQFIRAEGFVFGHIADEGWTNASAGTLLRYRHMIGADNISVFTDIKKKHSSHAVTADVSLKDTIKAAEFFLSDGIILTGTATGEEVATSEYQEAKKFAQGPVIIGSGVTVVNVHKYSGADAVIVGSHFKKDGRWENDIDTDALQRFMERVAELRNKKSKMFSK